MASILGAVGEEQVLLDAERGEDRDEIEEVSSCFMDI